MFLNNCLELLKMVLPDDNFICWEILSRRFFIVWGGWLEFTFPSTKLDSSVWHLMKKTL